MFHKIREAQQGDREEGFTLIELLVVVIIIGILAAIAIPTFLNQREKAWTKAAQSDLRNNAVKMEECFDSTGSYDGCGGTVTFKVSDDVTVTAPQDGDGGYCLAADHAKLGTGVDYILDSKDGKPKAGVATDCTTY